MYPVLARIGPLTIHAYGVALALAFVAGTLWIRRECGRRGIDKQIAIDLVLAAAVGGMVGARMAFVAAHWDYFATHPIEMLLLNQGGLVFYGGLIAAAAWSVRFLRREKMPFWKVADLAAPGIAIALFCARLGCFLGGCCFGSRCEGPLCVRFPPYSAASLRHFQNGWLTTDAQSSLGVHPAQIYEALLSLGVYLALVVVVAPRKRRSGEVFAWLLILYGVARFAVEFWRDDDRGALFALSTSQWISLAAILGAALWMGKNPRPAAGTTIGHPAPR